MISWIIKKSSLKYKFYFNSPQICTYKLLKNKQQLPLLNKQFLNKLYIKNQNISTSYKNMCFKCLILATIYNYYQSCTRSFLYHIRLKFYFDLTIRETKIMRYTSFEKNLRTLIDLQWHQQHH